MNCSVWFGWSDFYSEMFEKIVNREDLFRAQVFFFFFIFKLKLIS